METKENAFPLPVAIVLYELSFFRTAERAQRVPLVSRVLLVSPFVLTLLVIPLTMTGFGANLDDIGATFTASNEISRHDYLLTQLRVLVAYVRLLFWPVNQSIDHAVPVHHAFLEPAVFLSFLFLGSVCGIVCVLHFRSRTSAHPARLIAFGIFWFFLMISVESSVIPIGDVMVEHRLYLPSVGAWIALAAAAAWVGDAVHRRARGEEKIVVALGAIVVAILSAAAFVRNSVWRNELAVWEDAVTKYPEAARARNMLGTLYEESGWRSQAIDTYRTAIAVKPSYAEAHVNLGRAYVAQGKVDEGLGELMIALQYVQHMDEIDTAYLFASIGKCYGMKGLPEKELAYYNDALRLIPGDASIHVLIGQAYVARGMPEKARQSFDRAHQLNPDRF